MTNIFIFISSLAQNNVSFSGVSKGQNLAWLVTPILLLLGAAYGIYKCARDGVCTAIRHRIMDGRRHRGLYSNTGFRCW